MTKLREMSIEDIEQIVEHKLLEILGDPDSGLIKRGFLHNLELLYNKIVLSERWSDVQQYISNLASSPGRYQLGTILDALTRLWQAIEEKRPFELVERYGNIPLGKILKINTLSFLRIWIRRLLSSIDRFFDEVVNPMKCFPDIKIPPQ